MTLEERLTNLENLVYAFINSQNAIDEYRGYDIDGCRHTDGEQQSEIDGTKETVDLSLGVTEHNAEDRNYIAQQTNRLNQLTLSKTELTEEESLEVADLYPLWEEEKRYKVDDIVKWGWDDEGFTKLWRVIQEHTSQADWTPDKAVSLFKQIGFTPAGYPIWVQPLGGHDAYSKGEIVEHKDKLWESTVDGNVWEPGVVASVWVEYE